MATSYETYSRQVFTTDVADETVFTFEFDFPEDGTSRLQIFLEGAEVPPNRYTLDGKTITFVSLPPIATGTTIEVVRVTPPPSGDPTPKQLLRMIQEAADKAVFMNGHGLSLIPTDSEASSLLENTINGVSFPLVQFLPDGGLTVDPRAVNVGGFDSSAFRFQHTVPAAIGARSTTAALMSFVVEAPPQGSATGPSTYYGLKVTMRGYQSAQQVGGRTLSQENAALNAISETAAGVTSGQSQGSASAARTIREGAKWGQAFGCPERGGRQLPMPSADA